MDRPPNENGDVAQIVCNTKCVPTFTRIANRSVKQPCSKEIYNDMSCLLERPRESSFYEVIDWDALYDHITDYTRRLEKAVMGDVSLSRDIQTLYTFGPFPLEKDWGESRPPQYAILDIQPLTNRDDYKFCQDLILKIYISRGIGAKGKKKQVIGHISLHPKLPKYYQNRLRTHDGCGYFPKTNANANGGEGDSPFQYVIESVKWKSIEFKSTNPLRPYLPMVADPDHPGMFIPVTGPFPQVDKAEFPDPSHPMTDAEKALLQSIHKRIANHFIRLWNTVFQVGSANLPKVRRTLGGGKRRKTRKLKPSRK